MTKKEFNTRIKDLYTIYGLIPTAHDPNKVNIQTPCGIVSVRAEHNGLLKTSSIYSKVFGDIKRFVNETGYKANLFNGKLNSHSTDPHHLLNELEEYINNLYFSLVVKLFIKPAPILRSAPANKLAPNICSTVCIVSMSLILVVNHVV